MKKLMLTPQDLRGKAATARTDVGSLAALRNIPVPEDGASFLVGRNLYVWVAADRTPDDGDASIKPAKGAGRYLRPTLASPLIPR